MSEPELVFLLAAESDMQLAYEFQEELQHGRGVILIQRLDDALGRLRQFPEGAPVYHKAYRRLLVPGFPYGIFYSMVGRRIIIAGVLDLRQNPSSVLRRLKGCKD